VSGRSRFSDGDALALGEPPADRGDDDAEEENPAADDTAAAAAAAAAPPELVASHGAPGCSV